MSNIPDRVRSIISIHLGVEIEKITDDASILDDLGADSLDSVELVMAFEEAFDIEIPDEDFEAVKTVGDAVKAVQKIAGVAA